MCKFVNNTKHNRVDKCMRPLIKWLNFHNYKTVASCCGHEKYSMTIIFYDHNSKFPIDHIKSKEPYWYRELLSEKLKMSNAMFYSR